MAMILTESGFITQSENKPESMFKVGDLIRPTLNNQFDGMSTDEIWEVVEVNGYDRMNGYIYTIKPNNDAAKAYRSENSTDGEAEGFAEIAGFENSPEEQAWTLANESIVESFEYDETSEEDQGLFDSIGTQVVDTLFPGVQFEADEMEKLDDAIDKLIYVYKSVKSRSAKTANESIDNKHYKNVNTVNGKNVVAANLSSEHKEYKDTYLGYVSFELDDGSDICYPVDLDGNLVDDKNAWEFIKMQGLPKVTFGGKVIKESKDIDTLLDAAGGVEEARMGIAMTLQNHPDMDEEELAEFLADDEISYEEWLSIIEYLGVDID